MTTQLEIAGTPSGSADGASSPFPAKAPSATYDQILAVNWSSLKHLAVSPLLYRWRIDHPSETTPSLALGAAVHCLLLEPGKFDSRYAVYDGTRRGKVWDEWQEDHPGVASLKPDEMSRVEQTAAAVRRHRVATRLLDGCRVEEPSTWTDPGTGLACKGRIDAIGPSYVLDLKSTRDPAPKKFERASAEYLYHGQLAFYHDGATVARKINGDIPPYIIAAEHGEPFDVAVFQLADETLAAGRALYRSLLRRLIQCTDASWWPGCCPDLQPLLLPKWSTEKDPGALTEDEF